MTIVDFSPWPALAGGALIGVASAWLLLANGRIAGVSGILHNAIASPASRGARWQLAFVAGLVAAGFLVLAWSPGAFVARSAFPLGWVALAGVLVGFGTRMANGCTSGHGVCGLGLRSVRSLAAVLTFMLCGGIATWVVRHLLGVAS